jgi:hypothetical protein
MIKKTFLIAAVAIVPAYASSCIEPTDNSIKVSSNK